MSDTEFMDHVTRSSLTIKAQVQDIYALAKKLRDEPYQYDNPIDEFKHDLNLLVDKISCLRNEVDK